MYQTPLPATTGLYDQYNTHLVALDCIIFGFDQKELKILLIKRGFEPERGKWSLMGGFLKSLESVNEAARRILLELTGLQDVYMEQLYAYGDVQRDPVARTISIAYYALIRTDKYNREIAEEYQAQWFPVSQMPPLIFDHSIMVERALARLRRKTHTQPIGFELLPEKFTIPQLRSLYEAINDKMYDPRNFSKKVGSMEWLIRLDEKDKTTSRKGAYYYHFDREKYQQMLSEGSNFEL
jgi:ADP-ribose pyrophosphatase YjhB (NUDIX family)